ncbi:acid phosphatase type 7-like isoform X1 [Physella acuta]|uniref:acid phosphatase type 7-like isoform X1 n=2 Tax=Physella acuta TaxID=109671 RepID=UPI0027DD3288|nr:acid phosphatase type 7-like isoform X1 [Physella acuta]
MLSFRMTCLKNLVGVSLVLSFIPYTYSYPDILLVRPDQIHISYGLTPQQMVITWSQLSQTEVVVVRYGINNLDQQKMGNCSKFVDGGTQRRTQFICKVTLDDLVPGKTYSYVVGNEFEFSDKYIFEAMEDGQDWSPRLAIYGDMGNVNARSLARLELEAYSGVYDAILHVGDFAYDFNDIQGTVGDEFMRQIQPLATRVPYMTCPGNHEEAYNFSHYRNRFNMPGDDGKMYYSFNMGPVHFVSISTELIFFWYYGPMQVFYQYEWLKKDLENANLPENRAKQPWIVVFGHRPMYCSSDDTDDCTKFESITRKGVPGLHIFGLEDVLYDNGVDLAIWAHEHSYERLWPIYDRKVMNGSYDHPYTDAKAPIHIITGSAGCRENVSGFVPTPPEWSAFHSMDYGYTRMHVLNKTHMYLEQVSDIKDGQVIDKFTIIKNWHGSFDKSGMKRARDLPNSLIKTGYNLNKETHNP